MPESTQHKLDRVRPPRVQITYDVEVGDSIQMKELPFVGGILADLSGNPEEPLPKLKERKFVEIDRDNFNDVMAAINPRIVLQADNKLNDDGSKFNIELKFSSMDDFHPVNVLKQVEPLKKLYDARQRLSDLLTKLDGNDDLDKLIQDVVASTESMQELKSQVVATEAALPESGTPAGAVTPPETGDKSDDAS
jgi:type VI secretion system protein ImpB